MPYLHTFPQFGCWAVKCPSLHLAHHYHAVSFEAFKSEDGLIICLHCLRHCYCCWVHFKYRPTPGSWFILNVLLKIFSFCLLIGLQSFTVIKHKYRKFEYFILLKPQVNHAFKYCNESDIIHYISPLTITEHTHLLCTFPFICLDWFFRG